MAAAILEQHVADAAFLWRLRDAAVVAPHHDLASLSALDERLEANLDALRLGGDLAWTLCEAALTGCDPGAVFAAAVVAGTDAARLALVVELVDKADAPEAERGLVSALGWLEPEVASLHLPGLLAAAPPGLRRLLGIGASVAHRSDPGFLLDDALDAGFARLRTRALLAAGELGRSDLLGRVRSHLASSDADARFAAAWTLALLGDRDGADALAAVAELGGPRAETAAVLALRRLEPRAAAAWVRRTADGPGAARIALIGAGATGDPAHVPFVLACIDTPELARVAAEAFCTIAGADLDRDRLRGSAPEGFEAGPNDDPADPNVAEDPDGKLPWPDAARVRRYWEMHRGAMSAGTRHLLGRQLETPWLEHVLREGHQRQRHAAALELARLPGRGLFEVRAPAFRQLERLG